MMSLIGDREPTMPRSTYLALALVVVGVASAAAQVRHARPASRPAASASPSAACAKLAADYDRASKDLAMNAAEDIGDDSAPRATMREAENNNTLAQARLTMDLMKNNSCTMPTAAPDASRYFSSALSCHSDMLRARYQGSHDQPASCDRAKWVPGDQPPTGGGA